MDEIGPGALRVVAVAGCDVDLRRILGEWIRSEDVRLISPAVALVYTDAENAAIRDWVRPHVDGGSVIVVEFERWSAHGDIDAAWLLRRGH